MKDILLIGAVIGVFVFGYFVMGKLDGVLDKAVSQEEAGTEMVGVQARETKFLLAADGKGAKSTGNRLGGRICAEKGGKGEKLLWGLRQP